MHCLTSVCRNRQRGASALEFALVFPIFFALFYSIACFGLIFTLQQSLSLAAQTAARAAMVADPSTSAGYDAYKQHVVELAREEAGITLDWMPQQWKNLVLGPNNQKVDVQVTTDADDISWVEVKIIYPNYSNNPILPLIQLPGMDFPPVPDELVGQATLRL